MNQLSKHLLIAVVLIFGLPHLGLSQGCSDAGICTLEKIKPGTEMSHTDNQVRFGIGYGNADHGILVITPYLAYSRKFDRTTLEARLTSISQSGNEASVFGLSDIYLVGNYQLAKTLQFSAGVKIPLNDANRLQDGLPLPMDYQSSLGTVDLLLGLLYTVQKLELALAYQQPLTQNGNTFLTEAYPSESDFNRFQSTNRYIRNGDILLRASYPISIGRAFVLTPSLLPIYHLADDKFTNAVEEEETIFGSEGLTLNLNFYADIPVGENNNLQVNMGTPLIYRDARPDGLTRSFVVNFEYQVNF